MGDAADALFLIKSGEVVVHKRKPGESKDKSADLGRIKMGEFFGESALQSEAGADVRQANIVAVGPVRARPSLEPRPCISPRSCLDLDSISARSPPPRCVR
jgi:hypothetical protein